MAMEWVVRSCAFPHLIANTPTCLDRFDDHKKFDTDKFDASDRKTGCFQMPTNYPRYTKEDYANMEERKVDMLLRQYGLDHHVKGTLDEKRRFAMGMFLWPDQL